MYSLFSTNRGSKFYSNLIMNEKYWSSSQLKNSLFLASAGLFGIMKKCLKLCKNSENRKSLKIWS